MVLLNGTLGVSVLQTNKSPNASRFKSEMDLDEGFNFTKEATQKILDKLVYNK